MRAQLDCWEGRVARAHIFACLEYLYGRLTATCGPHGAVCGVLSASCGLRPASCNPDTAAFIRRLSSCGPCVVLCILRGFQWYSLHCLRSLHSNMRSTRVNMWSAHWLTVYLPCSVACAALRGRDVVAQPIALWTLLILIFCKFFV